MNSVKIVLLGYMGSGKTTIGKIVANRLNIKFLDLDHYIESEENKTIAAIFKEKGEVYFRKKEQYYLEALLTTKNEFVLSVGGGTPCFGSNMELINESTPNVFYINVGINELAERLAGEKEERPLIAHLQNEELPEFIGKHLFERSFFYNKAHHRIKAQKESPTQLARAVIEALI